jgi:pimeloyl-ACP methyl ester carboxylesterase
MNFVFLHGGGQGSWVWQETLTALAKLSSDRRLHTLTLDVPGCGTKRGRDTTHLSLDEVVDELLRDIEAAKLRDVMLVGHSQAGTLLPRMAEKQPALFHRLIYVSCSAPLPGQTVLQMIGRGVHGSHPDEVGWPMDPATTPKPDLYRHMFCNDMSAEQAAQFFAKLGHDRWPDQCMAESGWRYDNLRNVPSTYVLCQLDGILTPLWQEKFAARLNVRRVVHIEAGHQVMNTQHQALADTLAHEASIATL